MAMMNSEARKRAAGAHGGPDPQTVAAQLADDWDRQADHEDARGNGFAAVILHQHARQLREALHPPLSA